MTKQSAEKVKQLIESNGYQAYEVGGAVRDKLLGKPATDIDLATDISVSLLKEICDAEQISCKMALDTKETKVLIVFGIEVTEFRQDVYDKELNFVKAKTASIIDDANRRDFTINALYERNDQILDFVGGQEDIRQKRIRTCGDPILRFNEDPSRIVRAAYLAAKLDFHIDIEIISCVKHNKELLKNIHPSLMGKMIAKAIHAGVFHNFIEQLELLDIVFDAFPLWAVQKDCPQNPLYHHLDVWEHTKKVVHHAELASPSNVTHILAAFCHDIAKGIPSIRTIRKGYPSDLDHEKVGAQIAYDWIISLGFGKMMALEIKNLVYYHGIRPALTERSMKRTLKSMAKETHYQNKQELSSFFHRLLDLMLNDACGFAPEFSANQIQYLIKIREILPSVIDAYAYTRNDLPFTGQFIIEHSSLRGKDIGYFLEECVQQDILTEEKIKARLHNVTQRGGYPDGF